MHYTQPVELAAFSAWLSPNDLLFAEVRLRGVACAVPILGARTVLPQQRIERKDPRHSPQSLDPSFQYAAAADRAPSEVVRSAPVQLSTSAGPRVTQSSQFSHRQRFIIGPEGAHQKLR
jgi:hypothetical protein